MNDAVERMLGDHVYSHVATLAMCANQRVELFGQDLGIDCRRGNRAITRKTRLAK